MTTLEILIEGIGWLGAILVLLAYLLVSNEKLKSDSAKYQWINFFGGFFLSIKSTYVLAYPLMFINSVWTLIAIKALIDIARKK